MKSPDSSPIRATESRFQSVINMAAAPCPPLHACSATSSTRTTDIQGKEGDVPQPQPEVCLGLGHLSFLTLNISGPYTTPTSSISVDAASPNCKHRSKRWDLSTRLLSIPRRMRAKMEGSCWPNLATGHQQDWTQLFCLICRSLLPALPFPTNKLFPETWELSSFSIPLIKDPPKIVDVLWRFDEKEIHFNSIPHLIPTTMDLWHEKGDSLFCWV